MEEQDELVFQAGGTAGAKAQLPLRGLVGKRNRSRLVEDLGWWVKGLELYSEGSWQMVWGQQWRSQLNLGAQATTMVSEELGWGLGDPGWPSHCWSEHKAFSVLMNLALSSL